MDSQILKNYWFWVVLVLAIGFLSFFSFNLPVNQPQPGQSSLVLHFGNGSVRKFEGPSISDMTVLEALYSASVGGHFDFRYSINKNGDFELEKIDNDVNFSTQPSWHFSLNNSPVQTKDLNKITIKSGDSIEARYE